jgi:hypothetical protein
MERHILTVRNKLVIIKALRLRHWFMKFKKPHNKTAGRSKIPRCLSVVETSIDIGMRGTRLCFRTWE